MPSEPASIPSFDFLDILAVILGVFYTIRKLDIARREAAQFPKVPPDQFELWKRRQGAAYTLGMTACLLKLVVDFAFVHLAWGRLEPSLLRTGGMAIDLTWAAAMFIAIYRGARARKIAGRLGIVLGPIGPVVRVPEDEADAKDESEQK